MGISRILSIFRFGVRQKVLLVLLCVLLTALTVSTWLTLEEEKQTLLKQINQRGSDISRFVAKALSFSVVGYDYHTIQLLIDEVTVSEDVGYARVISSKGNTMAESGTKVEKGDVGLVIFTQEILLEDQSVGTLELGFSTSQTIQSLEANKYTRLKRNAFIILFIAIGEFLALSYIIIRPVSEITGSISKSVDESGKIVKRLTVSSGDEFGQMAAAFNELGERLNKANDKLHSKIQLADEKLVKTNKQLKKQSKELEVISEEFKKLSITDTLTGIYNRRKYEELIKKDIELTNRYGDANSMLLMDLDDFKKINDNYGHPCGDKVIKTFVELVKSNIRSCDAICRIGGDEFVVLLRRADKNESTQIGEKLRKLIEGTKITCGDNEITCTISVGITTIDEENETDDHQDVYRQADLAVYNSKYAGRNRVVHFDDIEDAKET